MAGIKEIMAAIIKAVYSRLARALPIDYYQGSFSGGGIGCRVGEIA